jgi:hypothetical protein
MSHRINLPFVVGVFLVASGCEGVPLDVGFNPDLTRQVQDAIDAVKGFTEVADRTPDSLRKAADAVVEKLRIEGRDFLAHEARQFTDHTIGQSGATVKGSIQFADRKMVAYMIALKKGLTEKWLPT